VGVPIFFFKKLAVLKSTDARRTEEDADSVDRADRVFSGVSWLPSSLLYNA
jgi:hypothetical protein